jgi:RND family efflux transporter MFP subunit
MKAPSVVLLLALFGVAGFVGGVGYSRWSRDSGAEAGQKGKRKILYWHDPMHPAYKSDKPGIAPDCGMRLEPVYADGGAGQAAARQEGKILHYRDPQDPDYTSDKPGLNPETGNDLEPVYEGDSASMPPGTIQVSPEKQQLIGVRYGQVGYVSDSQTVRAVGRVTVDETRISRVHTRVEGWIEKVFVDFTGQLVKQGQPMLILYSPEMLASQQEYLLALRAKDLLRGSTLSSAAEDTHSLIEVSRRRLELWGLDREQIEEISRTGNPLTNITIHSPVTGFVTTRNAFLKQKISPETELYTIADLSRVWIMADVFESDASLIRLGQAATVTLSYTPGRRFAAKVTYIQPQVDPETRTLQVRLEANNPGFQLKPGMFTDVEFSLRRQARLAVPASAVLDSGLRQTVFVDRGNGYLEPRHVVIGQRMGDQVGILSGLQAGERIVTSGTFLIDSESQLKAAASGMAAGHQHGVQETAPPPPASERPGGTHQHD